MIFRVKRIFVPISSHLLILVLLLTVMPYLSEWVPVTSWSQILGIYCEYLYDENSDFTDQIMNSEKTKNWISNDSKRFFNSVKIHDTGLVVNVATNTNQKIRLMRELAEMFNVDKISINIELTKPIEQ